MNRAAFLIVCEDAFITKGTENLNIIGIFEKIRTNQFPVQHPKMAIATRLETDRQEESSAEMAFSVNGVEKHRESIRFTATKWNWVHILQNVTFETEGNLTIELILNGERVAGTEVNVEES